LTGSSQQRAAAAFVVFAALGAVALWILTGPHPLDGAALPAHTPDLADGEVLFHTGSCGSCHKAADGAPGTDEGLPTGSAAFPTPVGTFYPGNLTPDPETGIGRWSEVDFVNAVTQGVSPDGTHYFPAFPYPSLRLMALEDVLDLHAYLASLPAARSPHREAEVPMTPLARRGVGLWKRLEVVVSEDGRVPLVVRYYDRKDRLARTLYYSDVKNFDGHIIPSKLALIPEDKKGHKTELVYEAIDFDVPVPDRTFSLSNLERKK